MMTMEYKAIFIWALVIEAVAAQAAKSNNITAEIVGASSGTSARNISCLQCSTDEEVEPHKRCLKPGQPEITQAKIVNHTTAVKDCNQCFVMHKWINFTLDYEIRGCFTTDANSYHKCTIEYKMSAKKEVWEVCRCRDKDFCNSVTITEMGGMGDINLFPTTTTPASLLESGASNPYRPVFKMRTIFKHWNTLLSTTLAMTFVFPTWYGILFNLSKDK